MTTEPQPPSPPLPAIILPLPSIPPTLDVPLPLSNPNTHVELAIPLLVLPSRPPHGAGRRQPFRPVHIPIRRELVPHGHGHRHGHGHQPFALDVHLLSPLAPRPRPPALALLLAAPRLDVYCDYVDDVRFFDGRRGWRGWELQRGRRGKGRGGGWWWWWRRGDDAGFFLADPGCPVGGGAGEVEDLFAVVFLGAVSLG